MLNWNVNFASSLSRNIFNFAVLLPKGDIEVEVGSDQFPLYCHLDPSHRYFTDYGLRSKDLSINIRSSKLGSNVALTKTIINETSIEAIYDPSEIANLNVDCTVNFPNGTSSSFCSGKIHVGTLPKEPENFTCISHNWNDLNCTWDVPYNPIRTQYILHYYEPGRRGR